MNHLNHKIAFKLTMYFAVTLLLFSAIIGSVFMTLFRNHSRDLYKTELEKRAVTMAETLSDYMGSSDTGMGMMGGKQGFGAYIRFLDDIAMTDVWIVDENLDLITAGHMAGQQYTYADLPADAETVVNAVFQGKTTFSEGFSTVLDAPTITVGTPIRSDDRVIGALLLHSPIEGMNQAITQGFGLLSVSILAALGLSVVLSIVLAFAFTKPLKQMKNTALQLADGDYSVKTGVRQQDEIGELAVTLDVLSERLAEARRESERLNTLRRDFVANISHELRTPVTVIRGSLEALCDEVVTNPEQVKTYHRQMLKESVFLQRLVDDLLDLSRLQNTDFNMDMQEINLCDVLSDAVHSARHRAHQKQVEIRLERDASPCPTIGDYGRLRQMFLIVLDNAIKFSPKNGIVTVALKNNAVFISDHGAGIAANDLPYIFDRFYKVESEENKNGTGLGLSITKQIADRHHIRISVNSRLQEGTEFCFQF